MLMNSMERIKKIHTFYFRMHELDIRSTSKSKAALGIEPVSFNIKQLRIYLPWMKKKVLNEILRQHFMTLLQFNYYECEYYHKFIPVNSSDDIEKRFNTETKKKIGTCIMFSKLINFMFSFSFLINFLWFLCLLQSFMCLWLLKDILHICQKKIALVSRKFFKWIVCNANAEAIKSMHSCFVAVRI